MAKTGKVMKDIGTKIVLADGKERTFKFDLNSLCILQDKFDDLEQAFAGISDRDFKVIRSLVFAILAHEEDDAFTEIDAGALVTMQNITEVADALQKSLTDSMPESSEEGK